MFRMVMVDNERAMANRIKMKFLHSNEDLFFMHDISVHVASTFNYYIDKLRVLLRDSYVRRL